MSTFEGVGDIAAISGLAAKVHTAYKGAPDDHIHISDEVEVLQLIINKAAQHLEKTALDKNSQQEGQKVLKGCKNILEDLNSFIEKYNSLSFGDSSQGFRRVKLGTDDIATLRARLISNTGLLSGFVQSCEIREIREMHAQITGLQRDNSRASLNSVTESTNTDKGYKELCIEGLNRIGGMINPLKKQPSTSESQDTASSNKIDENTTKKDQSQLPTVGTNWSVFGWARALPPIDFLVGPSMLAAATTGDTTAFISNLGYIRNINFEDERKETALHKAARGGYKEIVQLLLEKGVSVDTINNNKNTPLHLAAQKGHASTVELLLRGGANISVQAWDINCSTPLHFAARGGHTSVVALLLENGAQTDLGVWGDMVIQNRMTPLQLAARSGHTSTVELLAEKGALIKVVTTRGKAALHFAVQGGHTSTVELLIKKGASVKSSGYGLTDPTMLALQGGYSSILVLLHEATGLHRSMPGLDKGKNTPLHIAAQGGHVNMVKQIIEEGALINVRNEDNYTPLHLATLGGHTRTVELLLKKGALIEAVGVRDSTPLHLAAQNDYNRMVAVLLKEGASTDARNWFNNTSLHLAAESGHTNTAELLLEKGASTEALNIFKLTPLHLAAENGHTRTAELLLEKGASINAMGDYNTGTPLDNLTMGTSWQMGGYSPLHLAARSGHTSTAELLINKGASTEVMDRGKNTPLHLAAQNGHNSMVELLLREDDTPIDTLMGTLFSSNSSGDTPSGVAEEYGHSDIAELLSPWAWLCRQRETFRASNLAEARA